jgi:hypothetical protein
MKLSFRVAKSELSKTGWEESGCMWQQHSIIITNAGRPIFFGIGGMNNEIGVEILYWGEFGENFIQS